MQNFKISEAQTKNCFREGKVIQARSLSAAKSIASKAQVFEGTIIKVEAENGALLAYKTGGKWSDCDE